MSKKTINPDPWVRDQLDKYADLRWTINKAIAFAERYTTTTDKYGVLVVHERKSDQSMEVTSKK